MRDYEKLGEFYLGRRYDLAERALRDELLLYDSKDLTTHAVCVGMTGSGKTGLCISLLEEAAIDGIPAIAIDPKGDLGNLLLTFPDLAPEDFEPWVDAGAAARKELDRQQYAAEVARQWREGLAAWEEPPERIAKFRDAVDVAIYTPGSSAGLPLTVLGSFAAPAQAVLDDADALRERVVSAASGLLALVGVDADPIRSREHILLASLMDRAWRAGQDLDIAELIAQVQNPPLKKVGVIDLETFYPEKERLELAMRLNNLLASPSFASWLEGEPLDAGRLLFTAEGKPRLSIISIAHLSERERMFVVTLLLAEVLSWMRGQAGTTSLRALLYMDEVFGYFPPTANPPSKTPMLTLLKQARAYGLGVVLATQNPVDLDYKGLSNAGTWFLGRLQTERDKRRVLEGLEGASAQAGSTFDRGEMEATLAGLGSRVFLMNNVHEDRPVVMHTRWALSYLRGPLTRDQIQTLMAPRKQEAAAGSTPSGVLPDDLFSRTAGSRSGAEAGEEASLAAEEVELPANVPQLFAPCDTPAGEETTIVYRPLLLGRARLHFIRKTYKVDCWEERAAILEAEAEPPRSHAWDQAKIFAGDAAKLAGLDVEEQPLAGAQLAALSAALGQPATFRRLKKALKDFLYQKQERFIWKCTALKMQSQPEETEGEFRIRLRQRLRETRDQEVEELKKRYEKKIHAVQAKIGSGKKRLAREEDQYRRAKSRSIFSFGKTLVGTLLGRKTLSATNLDRASGTWGNLERTADQRSDVKEEEEKLAALSREFKALDEACLQEIEKIEQQYDYDSLRIEEISFRSRKNEMRLRPLAMLWVPWEEDAAGSARPLFQLPRSDRASQEAQSVQPPSETGP